MDEDLVWINHRENRLHVRLQSADPLPAEARFLTDGFTRILLAPKRHRHPHRPGSPRPCRRLHHHDLPPRHQTPGRRRSEPARSPLISPNSFQRRLSPHFCLGTLSVGG